MSFNLGTIRKPAAEIAAAVQAAVEQHRQWDMNAPTMKVLDSVTAATSALAEQYPDREIEVEAAGHFGTPEFTTDEGYATIKVRVLPKT